MYFPVQPPWSAIQWISVIEQKVSETTSDSSGDMSDDFLERERWYQLYVGTEFCERSKPSFIVAGSTDDDSDRFEFPDRTMYQVLEVWEVLWSIMKHYLDLYNIMMIILLLKLMIVWLWFDLIY